MSASITRSARSSDLCRVLYSHGFRVSRSLSLLFPISLSLLHRRSRIRSAIFVGTWLAAQLHGLEDRIWLSSRIRLTAHALPHGRGVSEFFKALYYQSTQSDY